MTNNEIYDIVKKLNDKLDVMQKDMRDISERLVKLEEGSKFFNARVAWWLLGGGGGLAIIIAIFKMIK